MIGEAHNLFNVFPRYSFTIYMPKYAFYANYEIVQKMM